MKRDKIYISGKISGLDFDETCRRFGKAEKHLHFPATPSLHSLVVPHP